MADTTQLYAGPVTSVEIGGTDVGCTFDGVVIEKAEDWLDLNCDQIRAPASKDLISRMFIVTLGVAEMSLANLEIALGMPSGNLVAASSSLKIDDGEQGSQTVEITVPSPDGNTRTYKFDIGYVMGDASHSYKKGEQTFLPIRIECMADASTGEFGYIADA